MGHYKKAISLLPTFLVLFAMLPIGITNTAGDAMPEEELIQLLNNVELHPQRTGYSDLDGGMRSILEPYREEDTYAKVKAAYE